MYVSASIHDRGVCVSARVPDGCVSVKVYVMSVCQFKCTYVCVNASVHDGYVSVNVYMVGVCQCKCI